MCQSRVQNVETKVIIAGPVKGRGELVIPEQEEHRGVW